MAKQGKPYGTWRSPISARATAEVQRLGDVAWDTTSETLIWVEGRGTKNVLVAQNGQQAPRDLTGDPAPRALVGYGGGEFTAAGGSVFFATPDGRLYRQPLEAGGARAITPGFGAAAAPRVSADGRWLLYVYSHDHEDGIGIVDTDGSQWPRKFACGTDFVMQPAWHPKNEYAAYIAWNHPQMPWDGTELRLVTLETDRGGFPMSATTETIAGDSRTAIFQPEFSPDGCYLAYISDQTGWNQLYVYDLVGKTHRQLTTAEADHATPAWIQGLHTYAWLPEGRALVVIINDRGFNSLWRVELDGKASKVPGLDDYTDLGQVAVSPVDGRTALIASSDKIPARVVSLPLEDTLIPTTLELPSEQPSIRVIVGSPVQASVHKRAGAENVPPEQLSAAKAISWTGHDGEAVYGLYYPPASDRFESAGIPPLIVYIHGGPTSQVRANYSATAQYFATRGYALLMVNYRGSTGYGKAYMDKLRDSWGVYDVEDAATGASHLAKQGLADPGKLVILGGSAGGFTVLQSLVDKPGFYKAGVCLYGVSNQFMLAMDTHKFEERYSDSLLGALPDAAPLYRERSPLYHAHKISDPIIIFQGEDDKVVPREQSDSIVASLRARGIPHEYHVYTGEGHGWRKIETIEHYYGAVERFLTQRVVFA